MVLTASHNLIGDYLTAELPLLEREKRFPKIGRIADLYWKERGLIIEIQCSPISLTEVVARNRDYQSLSLKVIWILHDRRYNRKVATAAEHYLRHKPCFFARTRGPKVQIYDQTETFYGRKRLHRSHPQPVNLTTFKKTLPFPKRAKPKRSLLNYLLFIGKQ